jgi:tetratricopeptide (TPR) repeat protein
VRLAVAPAPLVLLYTWPMAPSLGAVAPQAVLLAALVVITVFGVVRRHPVAFASASFVLILARPSSILPIVTEVAAEQRMYLPLAAIVACGATGVFLAGRACVPRLSGDPRVWTRLAFAAAVVLVVALGVALGLATRDRNRDYWTETGLWQQAVAAQPDILRARLAYGMALMSAGRFAEAEGPLQTVVDRDAGNALAHGRLGAAQAAQGKLDTAIVHLERAVALRPEDVDAHRWLGQAYAMRRSEALAVAHFDRALAAQPDDVGLLVEIAAILADPRDPAVRNGPRALVLAERAATLTSRADPRTLDVLAVAQAAVGRFTEAAATADEALKLARLGGNQAMIPELEYRVTAYRAMAAGR